MLIPIDLHNLAIGQQLNGLIYIQSYTKQLNPESKAPGNGKAVFQGKTVNFKVWKGPTQDILNNGDYEGQIAAISGVVTSYRDELDITISTIDFAHGFTDLGAFYKSVDVPKLWGDFGAFVGTHLSREATNVLNAVFGDAKVLEAFKVTWAGAKMHDAQVGGLMNHTFKMLRIAETLVQNDVRLEPEKDLLYISIIVHDIGKILEIGSGGIYTSNSFVGHRTLGLEIIARHRETIVSNFNETFYYKVLSVIQGHHGAEFGDAPTTVIAQIVAFIDMLESQTTSFLDKIENKDYREDINKYFFYNNYRLNI